MSKSEIQRLLNDPPPSWKGLFKKYKLPARPSAAKVISTILEFTPTGKQYGAKGAAAYTPPAAVRKAALKGLKLAHKYNYTSSSGIGLARGIQLALQPKIWERSVKRMNNYFTRHEIDKLGRNFGNDKDPSNGYMAWLLWGGDPGQKWAAMKVNPAPGYQSWQWTQQDWRSVILTGTKIDYSKKCGAKGTQLPDKSPRLCLPASVLDKLSKTAQGRKIIRDQARKKEKAKRGQRVAWHPEIKRLHNELEKMIPKDDPRLSNPVAQKIAAVSQVRDPKAKSSLVWLAEKARQVNPRANPIQYQFQGKIPLHMLKSITEVPGKGRGYSVRRSGKKVTITSAGEPNPACWILEAGAPTRDKKVPITFVIHEYPKRRANPLSDIVYHKVDLSTAVAIVESDKLMTSPAYGTPADAAINKGYLYFVSFMRSPQSGYRRGQDTHQVLIQLNGRKISERYAGAPVDYWGPMYRKGDPGIYEMEDRLFTDKEWIPNVKSYITAFHVAMVEPMRFDVLTDQVAELELLEQKAKKWKIPFYIYTKKASWKALRPPRHRTVSGWLNAYSKEIKEPSYRSTRDMSLYRREEFEGLIATLQAVIAYRKGDKKAFEKLKEGPHKEFFQTFSGYQSEQASKLSNLIHSTKNEPLARPYFAEIRKGMTALKKRTPQTLVKEMHKTINEENEIQQKKRRENWNASERTALQLVLAQKSAEKAWEQVAKRKAKGIKTLVEPDSKKRVPLQMVEDNLRTYRKRVEEYGGYGPWLEKSRGYIDYLPDHLKDLIVAARPNPKRRKNSKNPTKEQVLNWFQRWRDIQWEPWYDQRAMANEKHALMQSLITTAQHKGWPFGFGYDRFSRYSGVLYVDTPAGQVSFHTSVRPETDEDACKELERLAYALSQKGKLRQVGIKGYGKVFCWDAKSPKFKGGPFAHYRGKWDESRQTPNRIAELVSSGAIPWTFEIPPILNPKRRKNPKFKVGDRVIEGRRQGKVTALHSPGTVDVLFDDMDYAIRRQAPNVKRANSRRQNAKGKITAKEKRLIQEIHRAIEVHPELLKEPYRSKVVKGGAHPHTGHCYVASQALYAILGAKGGGYSPICMKHEGGSHWAVIRDKDGTILDPTSAQFRTTPDYSKAVRKGYSHPRQRDELGRFLPDKRSRKLISLVQKK
jgi:hypothetical protein